MLLHGTVVVVIVVYIDGLLVARATKREEEQALRDFYSCLPIKDLGGLGRQITRDRDTVTLKVDQF